MSNEILLMCPQNKILKFPEKTVFPFSREKYIALIVWFDRGFYCPQSFVLHQEIPVFPGVAKTHVDKNPTAKRQARKR